MLTPICDEAVGLDMWDDSYMGADAGNPVILIGHHFCVCSLARWRLKLTHAIHSPGPRSVSGSSTKIIAPDRNNEAHIT